MPCLQRGRGVRLELAAHRGVAAPASGVHPELLDEAEVIAEEDVPGCIHCSCGLFLELSAKHHPEVDRVWGLGVY